MESSKYALFRELAHRALFAKDEAETLTVLTEAGRALCASGDTDPVEWRMERSGTGVHITVHTLEDGISVLDVALLESLAAVAEMALSLPFRPR
jgi:hypothetical protein